MTIHRFFLPSDCFQKERISVSDKALVKQMSLVLRAKKGDKVIFLDNSGMEYLTELTVFAKNEITAEILNVVENKNEEDCDIYLYQSITKRLEPFELVLQKGTELGVRTFVPLITERCQRDFLPKRDRLERIICEAAEQSERGILPELLPEVNFETAIKEVGDNDDNIFCWERLESVENHKLKIKNKRINIFIGPEGGYSDREVDLIKSLGEKFKIVSLGKRILRTETAAIVAVARLSI